VKNAHAHPSIGLGIIMTSLERSMSVALLVMEKERRTALQEMLTALGHQATVFADAAELLIAFCIGQRFDVLLLTLHDPSLHQSMSEVCKRLCIPTLLVVNDEDWAFLLPRANEESAWDDVIEFDVLQTRAQELNWRVQTLLHRRRSSSRASKLESEMTWGDYRFIPDSTTVLHRGREIRLSPLELAFALELFRNVGRVLTRDWLLNSLWTNRRRLESQRTVDVCATKVRKKLSLCEENGFVLRAIYGQGYQLVPVPLAARASLKAQ
jgi:DNA-binding response OmpR family regulator